MKKYVCQKCGDQVTFRDYLKKEQVCFACYIGTDTIKRMMSYGEEVEEMIKNGTLVPSQRAYDAFSKAAKGK